jgi:hypothetical protein
MLAPRNGHWMATEKVTCCAALFLFDDDVE